MVGFTRSRRKQFERPLTIHGQPLKYVDTVKYLGLLLDKRLTWRPHILEMLVLCKQYLLKMANIAHTTWGPKPQLMRWVYRCVVRPKFTYGAMLWYHSVKTKGMITRLRRLNRLGMNTYATVHRSTPTRGLEIIIDTFLLNLYIQKEAVCAYVRLQNVLTLTWEGLHRRNPHIRLHLLSLQHAVRDHGIYQLMLDMDVCVAVRPPCTFIIHDSSFRNREAYRSFLPEVCKIFTDGSKLNGRVGASFVIYILHQRIYTGRFCLPDYCSVSGRIICNLSSVSLYSNTQYKLADNFLCRLSSFFASTFK